MQVGATVQCATGRFTTRRPMQLDQSDCPLPELLRRRAPLSQASQPKPTGRPKRCCQPKPTGRGQTHVYERNSIEIKNRSRKLLADAKLRDDGLVALGVVLLQIVQQTTSLADHHKKTAAGRMVLLVRAEMICELSDSFAQNCNLNFRTPRIIRVGGVLRDDIGLLISC